MSADTFSIGDVEIARGQTKLIRLPIAKLPTGTVIDLPVHVFRGKTAGPTVLLLGGLHGDEVNGVEILRRMLRQGLCHVERGTLLVIPILNIFGFIHFSRDVPDGKDINRSFPGSRRGSLASRVAWTFMSEVFKHADLAIDFHTGGARRDNYPQVRYTAGDDASLRLARQFSAPFMLESSLIAKSFRSVARKRGKPVIVYEAGESLRFSERAIDEGVRGARRVLKALDMIDDPIDAAPSTRHVKASSWVRAPRAGLFGVEVEAGQWVDKGQVLGHLSDTLGAYEKAIKAKKAGWVITINHLPVVNRGDAIVRLAAEIPGG